MGKRVRTHTLPKVLLAILTVSFMGARYQSANFIVDAADPKLAVKVIQAAETYRHDLAVEWLGQPIPDWPQPCVMTVQAGQNLKPAGATTSFFEQGTAIVAQMNIQGSPERILQSVLPHEITHAIYASHFRRQLPRWADEGGAINVETASVKSGHRKTLLEILRANRGIEFGRMFAMTTYPQDAMPLYVQGYSVAEFLIQRGGRQEFIKFLDDGLRTGQWSLALRNRYGITDLGALQNTWTAWVSQGFPDQQPPRQTTAAVAGPRDTVTQ
jgi:hypothetical protein